MFFNIEIEQDIINKLVPIEKILIRMRSDLDRTNPGWRDKISYRIEK